MRSKLLREYCDLHLPTESTEPEQDFSQPRLPLAVPPSLPPSQVPTMHSAHNVAKSEGEETDRELSQERRGMISEWEAEGQWNWERKREQRKETQTKGNKNEERGPFLGWWGRYKQE